MIHVATARWCEDHWVIAAGRDEAKVRAAADLWIEQEAQEPRDHLGYNPRTGRPSPEDYIIESVEETV